MSTTKNRIILVVLFALLLVPNVCAVFMASDLTYSLAKILVYLLVVVLTLSVPLLFLKTRWYFLCEGIFTLLLSPLELASLYLYKSPSSAAFLGTICNTNWNEAAELLSSLWPLLVLYFAVVALYFYLSLKVNNVYLFSRKIKISFFIGIVATLLAGEVFFVVYLKRIHADMPIRSALCQSFELMSMKYEKIYPYNIYINYVKLRQQDRQVRLQLQQVADFSFGITPVNDSVPEIFVLVIGETARYHNFSINGYSRKTTPRLQERTNLVSFDHIYSQANLTSNSVPLLLTRATASQPNLQYEEKSISEAFQEAGYTTAWLSCQSNSTFTERIARSADFEYNTATRIDLENCYDNRLLPVLDSFLKQHACGKTLVILHTLGSHFRYNQRYPNSFAQFQPTIGADFYQTIQDKDREKLLNAYDNSILYTDYILDSIISMVDAYNYSASVMYISDHGESLFDDEHELSMHGSFVITDWEYHVPFVVWYSDEYAQCHSAKTQNLVNNKAVCQNSSVVFHSLLDLADIGEHIVDSTRSVASGGLQALDTIYVLNGNNELKPFVPTK